MDQIIITTITTITDTTKVVKGIGLLKFLVALFLSWDGD